MHTEPAGKVSSNVSTPAPFDRWKLSQREDEILSLGIEGLTDIQISLRMDIAVSTVNSYWVRIRGKLGQLSRTELVALALKQKAQGEMDLANAELTELRAAAEQHTQDSQDFANSEIYRAALDAMPEAMLVGCHQGLIRFANARLETMFGYDEGELVGEPIGVLVPAHLRQQEGLRLAAYLEDPQPMRIGLGNTAYGQRKNGTVFRIVLLLDSRPTSNGPIVSCIVRDFTSEIETRRQHAAGWV